MRNIKRACFAAVNASINDAFKVSNDPAIQGWHAGMHVIEIWDQLSNINGQPTPAVMEQNDTTFRGPYSAAKAPEVLFCCIEDCAKIPLLWHNPYTNCQLINSAIRLLLTTGLYTWPFEEWSQFQPPAQTWIALRMMIQQAFQRCLSTPWHCLFSRMPLECWQKKSLMKSLPLLQLKPKSQATNGSHRSYKCAHCGQSACNT